MRPAVLAPLLAWVALLAAPACRPALIGEFPAEGPGASAVGADAASGPVDAGTHSGAPLDAGTAGADAGTPADSGIAPLPGDGGPGDTGGQRDAGGSVDAGGLPDAGRADAGFDAGTVPVVTLDGGFRASTWRVGVPPILNDVARWYVPEQSARFVYPAGRLQSPVPLELAEHWRNVVLHGSGANENVFIKVGDSITASDKFFGCYRGDVQGLAQPWEYNIRLEGRTSLAETLLHYRSARIGATSPFDRSSLSAKPGMGVSWPLSGAPSPLDQEVSALHPSVAVVMYGTNDLSAGGTALAPVESKVVPYYRGLLTLVDTLLSKGILPIVSTVPPRTDELGYREVVPVLNEAARAVAQARQVPLVDFHQALLALPTFGLSGDGMHPSSQDYNTACHFDSNGLLYGYNVRNLVTLEALDRVMRVVVDGANQLDATASKLAGTGAVAAPFVIPSLPFSDSRTLSAAASALSSYPGCAGGRPGAGPEHLYKLTLTQPTALRAMVFDRAAPVGLTPSPALADVDVHLLNSTASGAGCLANGDSLVQGTLGPGNYYFSVDAREAGPLGLAEYAFIVVPCHAADTRCAPQLAP